jgi:hypothetical protein
MNSPIVKIFTGRYVDLSRIVSITDAYFIDRTGSGGLYVGFDMIVDAIDHKPSYSTIKDPVEPVTLHYRRELTCNEYSPLKEGEWNFGKRYMLKCGEDGSTPLAVERLQKQVDKLVIQWIEARQRFAHDKEVLQNARISHLHFTLINDAIHDGWTFKDVEGQFILAEKGDKLLKIDTLNDLHKLEEE